MRIAIPSIGVVDVVDPAPQLLAALGRMSAVGPSVLPVQAPAAYTAQACVAPMVPAPMLPLHAPAASTAPTSMPPAHAPVAPPAPVPMPRVQASAIQALPSAAGPMQSAAEVERMLADPVLLTHILRALARGTAAETRPERSSSPPTTSAERPSSRDPLHRAEEAPAMMSVDNLAAGETAPHKPASLQPGERTLPATAAAPREAAGFLRCRSVAYCRRSRPPPSSMTTATRGSLRREPTSPSWGASPTCPRGARTQRSRRQRAVRRPCRVAKPR